MALVTYGAGAYREWTQQVVVTENKEGMRRLVDVACLITHHRTSYNKELGVRLIGCIIGRW